MTRRIAAIVLNSVSHDARVLKEADSLSAAGYQVTIFGVQDNRCNEPITWRPNGVRIVRCDWKAAAHEAVGRFFLCAGAVATLSAVVISITAFEWLMDFLARREAIRMGMVVGSLALLLPFYRMYRRQIQIARSCRTAGGPDGVGDSASMGEVIRSPMGMIATKIKNAIMRGMMKRTLVKAIGEFKPDAVHCHDLSTMPIGHAYAKRNGCKVVFDSHELYEEQSMASPMQKRVYRRRQQYYSDKVNAFVTINESIAEYLAKRYPALPSPVIVKNATVPAQEEIVDDGRLHRAAELSPTTKILLYQGGFALHRGLDVLVRAGALLPHEWCLVMMGWGKFEPQLRAIADQVDPAGRKIRFIAAAPQAELAAWTAGAALGVIPYENVCLNHWYCTPNKLWEYPVAGVPILASPFPELRKVVEKHNVGRLLSDPVTPENIAAVVASISEKELAELRRNCRTYIARDNWSVYERRLVELYDQLFGATRTDAGQAMIAEPKAMPAARKLESVRP